MSPSPDPSLPDPDDPGDDPHGPVLVQEGRAHGPRMRAGVLFDTTVQPAEHTLLHGQIAYTEERGDGAERRRLLVEHVGRFHPRTKERVLLADLGITRDELTFEELATLGWRPNALVTVRQTEVRRRERAPDEV